jgi:hypothetical protein
MLPTFAEQLQGGICKFLWFINGYEERLARRQSIDRDRFGRSDFGDKNRGLAPDVTRAKTRMPRHGRHDTGAMTRVP